MQTGPAPTRLPLSDRLDLDRWPGRERRSPPRGARHRLVLAPLVAGIRAAVAEHAGDRRDLHVLDIGCGEKPYLPLLARHAVEYRGIDYAPGPQVDDVGSAEELPYADGAFDVVLCTQVLEHVTDPPAVMREISRVLAPGGLALVSTHGVYVYHPDPPEQGHDYWRWTHRGLDRLFATTGAWETVSVRPCGEWIACLAYVACQTIDPIAARFGEPARRVAVAAWNTAAAWLDARVPAPNRTPAPGSLSSNYLVVARKRPA